MRGMLSRVSGRLGLLLVPVLALILSAGLGTLTPVANAEVVPASGAAPVVLAPEHWCRPVVSVMVDPDPLSCWLALAALEPGGFPAGLDGMNLGDLPPYTTLDVAELAASIDAFLARLEADRAAEARRSTTPSTGARRTDQYSGSGEEEWEEYKQYDPFDPNYEPDWDEQENGGYYEGGHNEIPPMPEECNGNGHYDTLWGGWSCAGLNG
jgi:hypothetical protein